MEELVLLVGMGAKEVVLALVQLLLEGFNRSSQAPLLCDQGGNFIVHVMVPLELSCNSPVLLGPQVVVHGHVCGVVGKGVKEPVGKFPIFINGDVLRWEQLMPVDGLTDTSSAKAVQPVMLDIGGKDMDGIIAISDWDKEV